MNDVRLQARIDRESYDLMMSHLEKDETVSDFVREAVKLKLTLRLLAKDD